MQLGHDLVPQFLPEDGNNADRSAALHPVETEGDGRDYGHHPAIGSRVHIEFTPETLIVAHRRSPPSFYGCNPYNGAQMSKLESCRRHLPRNVNTINNQTRSHTRDDQCGYHSLSLAFNVVALQHEALFMQHRGPTTPCFGAKVNAKPRNQHCSSIQRPISAL